MDDLLKEVAACQECAPHLPLGPRPIVRAAPAARLLIIGQAPGTRVHETGIPWHDKSGDRLRDWIGLSGDVFYDASRVAIMPMGFCYPGRDDKKGGDNPPRPECAPLWHARIRQQLTQIQLTLLIGQYAQKYYLAANKPKTMTETVRNWQAYLPEVFPLPHPSWRTTGWMKKNPWFETTVITALRGHVRGALQIRSLK